jgi:hypothetical protein
VITDIEVIVGVAGTLPRQDAVIGIVDRKSGNSGAERGSQFHALEDEVNAALIPALHASQVRTDVVFLADSFFGPLHGELTFPGEGLYPVMVIIGSLAARLLC